MLSSEKLRRTGRIARGSNPEGMIHVGRRENGSQKQDKSFKQTPHFVLTVYDRTLEFGKSAPLHPLYQQAVDTFGEKDPLKFNALPITLPGKDMASNLAVMKMRASGHREFDCKHNQYEDYTEQGIVISTPFNPDTMISLQTVPGMPRNVHVGAYARRMIGGREQIVPCPDDIRTCPYACSVDIDKKTGEPKIDEDTGEQKVLWNCKQRVILTCCLPKLGSMGIWKFWTSSGDSMNNLIGMLTLLETALASHAGRTLELMPLILKVKKGMVKHGKRKDPQPEVSLEFSQTMFGQYMALTEQVARQKLALSAAPSSAYEIQSQDHEPEPAVNLTLTGGNEVCSQIEILLPQAKPEVQTALRKVVEWWRANATTLTDEQLREQAIKLHEKLVKLQEHVAVHHPQDEPPVPDDSAEGGLFDADLAFIREHGTPDEAAQAEAALQQGQPDDFDAVLKTVKDRQAMGYEPGSEG